MEPNELSQEPALPVETLDSSAAPSPVEPLAESPPSPPPEQPPEPAKEESASQGETDFLKLMSGLNKTLDASASLIVAQRAWMLKVLEALELVEAHLPAQYRPTWDDLKESAKKLLRQKV